MIATGTRQRPGDGGCNEKGQGRQEDGKDRDKIPSHMEGTEAESKNRVRTGWSQT